MKRTQIVTISLWTFAFAFAAMPQANVRAAERKLNNLASVLVEVSGVSKPNTTITFTRSRAGWILISATCKGRGTVKLTLDTVPHSDSVIASAAGTGQPVEAVRYVAQGEHRLRVQSDGEINLEILVIKAIPELMHCGLGFNSAVKGYGLYDMEFLKKDILPNVTTLIVPHNIQLAPATIDDWHRQGKKFVAEVGINQQNKTGDEHFKFWTSFLDKAPILDGIIINEFGMNNPSPRPSPERQARAQQRHRLYEEAFAKMRGDERYRDKTVYAYFGGSGKKVNYEDTGTTFVRSLIDRDYRIALERYIFEVSSEQKSKDVLQLFIEGIADWEAKEPGVKEKMVITFGLFSMPPGGINKLPNVDYHVWMDQQMNIVANHPVMSDIGGLNWWTSLQADEETVRFVGKLYRHYGIEGRTDMLTKDPLFLTHIQNADFEKGTESWTCEPAEAGTIQAKSFPRYGRIEGRYMGLGRPADPEHIGDTFLWMKRSEKGPNKFSQTIKDLEPGRLYSMKMFSCDYNDLVNPKEKKEADANKFIGSIVLDGVEIDSTRSFSEMFASNPEPRIPVWITYFWNVFKAQGTTAKLTVSDWNKDQAQTGPFGQEQTFNFLEIQPYHE